MQILIAGVGLIGGSLAKALGAKHEIFGYDRQEVLEYALDNKIIDGAAQSTDSCDFVIVALPPLAALDFILHGKFKEGAVITDVCGVKDFLYKEISGRTDLRYVGCHPMAGKEKGGIKNSSELLFKDASLIITAGENTDMQAVSLAERVYLDAGFARVVKCPPQRHDEIIAYTSQLAHIVSNAYIKSPAAKYHKGFTGGSFQDMTRIAALDEQLWTELFTLSSQPLINELSGLIERLTDYKDALESCDRERLTELLKEGRLCKEGVEKQP